MEYNIYCDTVVNNIYTINDSLKTLDNALQVIGTKNDNKGLCNKIQVMQLGVNQIAHVTSTYLNKLKITCKRGDKQKLLQVEKLDHFEVVMNKFSSLQKDLANKRKSDPLLSVMIDENENAPSDPEEQNQAQMLQEARFRLDRLLERKRRFKQIESDLLEINQMFKVMESLVYQQEEIIDSIENNIDHAVGDVKEATEKLFEASRY